MSEEMPEFLKEFYSKYKKTKKVLWSREKSHTDALSAGFDVLKDGKTGDYNFENVDGKTIDNMVDKIVDVYLDRAHKELGLDKNKKYASDEEKDLFIDQILGLYTRFSKDTLKHYLKEKVDKGELDQLTHGQYIKDQAEHTKNLAGQLTQSAAAHLEDEHIDDIVKTIDKNGVIDASKIRLEELFPYILQYNDGDGTNPSKDHVKGKIYEKKEDKK